MKTVRVMVRAIGYVDLQRELIVAVPDDATDAEVQRIGEEVAETVHWDEDDFDPYSVCENADTEEVEVEEADAHDTPDFIASRNGADWEVSEPEAEEVPKLQGRAQEKGL